jgi:hypothetical protein
MENADHSVSYIYQDALNGFYLTDMHMLCTPKNSAVTEFSFYRIWMCSNMLYAFFMGVIGCPGSIGPV